MKEPMSGDDKAMQAKQQKAQQYANEPGRFTLLNMQIEVKGDNGNVVVEYRGKKWDCSCAEQAPCVHILAAKKMVHTNAGQMRRKYMSEFLTIQEVARILRVDDTTVRRWVKNGMLEAVELPNAGKRQGYRIKRETLDRLLEGSTITLP
jgi:excisionase family DNA binding protein